MLSRVALAPARAAPARRGRARAASTYVIIKRHDARTGASIDPETTTSRDAGNMMIQEEHEHTDASRMHAPPAHTSDITRRDGRVLWVVVRSDISSWAYGAQLDACMVVNCFLTYTVAYVPAHPKKIGTSTQYVVRPLADRLDRTAASELARIGARKAVPNMSRHIVEQLTHQTDRTR